MTREYNFTVVLERQPEGGFLVVVPALPEVVTFGETEKEALERAEDAIRLVVGYREDQGEPIPQQEEPSLRQENKQGVRVEPCAAARPRGDPRSRRAGLAPYALEKGKLRRAPIVKFVVPAYAKADKCLASTAILPPLNAAKSR
jgi:antitoxin HicB